MSSGNNNHYPYWAYTSVLLEEDLQKKSTYRDVHGFYEDTNWLGPTENSNGWWKRQCLFGEYGEDGVFKYTADIKTFEADVLTDFSACERPMLPKVGVRLDVALNDPSFYLTTLVDKREDAVTSQYKLKIVDATLFIDIKQLTTSLALATEKKLLESKVTYRTKRVDIRRIPLHKNQTSFSTDSLKQSETSPDRMLLFIVNSWLIDKPYGISPMYASRDVFEEDQAKVAFNKRKHAVLDNLRLTINNESLDLCSQASSQDELAKHHYFSLQEAYGATVLRDSVAVDLKDFLDGKYFIAYDLTKSRRAALSVPNVRQAVRQGHLKLEGHFSQQLPCNAYLYVISEYHSAVSVDKNRNVIYHFLD